MIIFPKLNNSLFIQINKIKNQPKQCKRKNNYLLKNSIKHFKNTILFSKMSNLDK